MSLNHATAFNAAIRKCLRALDEKIKLDNKAKKFLALNLWRVTDRIAATAAEVAGNKSVLEPADINNVLGDFLSSRSLSAAVMNGNEQLAEYDRGTLKFHPKRNYNTKRKKKQDESSSTELPEKILKPGHKKKGEPPKKLSATPPRKGKQQPSKEKSKVKSKKPVKEDKGTMTSEDAIPGPSQIKTEEKTLKKKKYIYEEKQHIELETEDVIQMRCAQDDSDDSQEPNEEEDNEEQYCPGVPKRKLRKVKTFTRSFYYEETESKDCKQFK